jgi:hypothetical protein
MSRSLEPIHQTGRAPPSHRVKAQFVFPTATLSFGEESHSSVTSGSTTDTAPGAEQPSNALASSTSPIRVPNPCPCPPWLPDSAHFVRQWWPVVPNLPHISCTVILFALHDTTAHRTVYTLTQHYLTVATPKPSEVGEGGESFVKEPVGADGGEVKPKHTLDETQASVLKMWYASKPFEVACTPDGAEGEEAGDPDMQPSNHRPLIAVDFGHAVWIEDVEADQDDDRTQQDGKALRFVTFPSVDADPWEENGGMANFVTTLEIPEELDLSHADTVNLDQSQGAVVVSVREGKVFILFYE